jgi:hypothetical protein
MNKQDIDQTRCDESGNFLTPLKIAEAQRDEFRDRCSRAKQALADARRAFERNDMRELGRILRDNTSMFWKSEGT